MLREDKIINKCGTFTEVLNYCTVTAHEKTHVI